MIKHIVLFRLKESLKPAEKMAVMEKFRREILALPQKMDIIKALEVGFNTNPDEHWDICLNSSFDNMEDVRFYSKFPDHVAAATALKQHVAERACVDYEA